MKDRDTTLNKLKDAIIDMCRRKGWGIDGIQNPQHVAMAMMVETMELLEHFAGISEADENALLSGGNYPGRVDIAEEMSDVLMYSMQLMYTLRVDISRNIDDSFSDGCTTIEQLRAFIGTYGVRPSEQAMRIGIKARFVLEVFQWMNEEQVVSLTAGKEPYRAAEAGAAFSDMFREILSLANMLDIDIATAITRKIAIVDKRVYPEDDPVR